MNFKKIAITGASVALLLASAAPGFAHWGGWDDDLSLTITNWASVENDVTTKADTGDNSIGGKFVWGGDITTGNAGAASAVLNTVNTNAVDLCGCLDDFDDVTINLGNGAHVDNDVYTKADTGDNSIHGRFVGGGLIDTGDAGATSYVQNVVNTNLLGDSN